MFGNYSEYKMVSAVRFLIFFLVDKYTENIVLNNIYNLTPQNLHITQKYINSFWALVIAKSQHSLV